jgi:hypothetical protein
MGPGSRFAWPGRQLKGYTGIGKIVVPAKAGTHSHRRYLFWNASATPPH